MSDEDDNAGAVALDRPEEEALRLKTLAEEKHTSGDLKSAFKYARRANMLHPSLDGLPEMITAFEILSAAATPVFESSSVDRNPTPDYYKVLQVERFSHINTIKKQYKKLALTLHPDKNPLAASEEAFKLVAEAVGVLSDKIRRKEYDMRLRIAMQAVATEEAEGDLETFWTACSACRLLHKFDKRYLGHNLMCPVCKKSFKAMEVDEERNNGEDVKKGEGVGGGQTRVSARIRERVAKGGNLGMVEKCGLGVKRKISSVANVLERSREKVARETGGGGDLLRDLKLKRVERVEKSGDRDGGGIEGSTSKTMQKMVNVYSRRYPGRRDLASKSGDVEMVESGRSQRAAKVREEETMTLSQMRMLAKKKKKLSEGRLMMKETEVNAEKLNVNENEGDNEKEEEGEKETEKVKENGREEEETDKEIEILKLREQRNGRRVSKDRNVNVAKRTSKNPRHLEIEKDGSSNNSSSEVLLVEKTQNGDGKEKEKEMEGMREKRERRRVSKYGNPEVVKKKTSKNHVDSALARLIAKKKDNLEIMSVEDSDFHDFDKDRRERSFKKGQVWALYDDDDGMPRHYALIDQIVSINPFEVTLSWLQFLSNGDDDDELTTWQRKGFHVSCGSFTVSGKASVNYRNLFSHVVDWERAAREVYRIYPKKGSVWALYNHSIGDKLCYDIVVTLSSYSDVHGISIGHLEKVPGFRTVFRRREIGANAVIFIGKNDVKLFSHEIPSKKLSGEEAPGLPKDCWELDPASLTPQLLVGS